MDIAMDILRCLVYYNPMVRNFGVKLVINYGDRVFNKFQTFDLLTLLCADILRRFIIMVENWY